LARKKLAENSTVFLTFLKKVYISNVRLLPQIFAHPLIQAGNIQKEGINLDFLTSKQVAQRLGVTVRHVQDMCRGGAILTFVSGTRKKQSQF
jgi:hypothetical protein